MILLICLPLSQKMQKLSPMWNIVMGNGNSLPIILPAGHRPSFHQLSVWRRQRVHLIFRATVSIDPGSTWSCRSRASSRWSPGWTGYGRIAANPHPSNVVVQCRDHSFLLQNKISALFKIARVPQCFILSVSKPISFLIYGSSLTTISDIGK